MLQGIPPTIATTSAAQAGGLWPLVAVGLLVTFLVLWTADDDSSESRQREDDENRRRVVRVRRVRVRRRRRRR